MSTEIIGDNYFNKYTSHNPLVKLLMGGFLQAFDAMVVRTSASTVYECGCGRGYLTRHMLARDLSVSACDIASEMIDDAIRMTKEAGYTCHYMVSDILALKDQQEIADLVVCCEVLEHVTDPETALQILRNLTREWCLVSVPNEPWWRMMNMARLAYVKQWGNTPGHIQHWSSGAFIALVQQYFDIVEVRRPFPWTMVLCRKRYQGFQGD